MLLFKPTPDERETLAKAVEKFAHDPYKSELLTRLQSPDAEYDHATEEWKKLKFCVEHHFLHAQTEERRNPTKKAAKQALAKADALFRKFNPNFS
jgi:hypothetical protein